MQRYAGLENWHGGLAAVMASAASKSLADKDAHIAVSGLGDELQEPEVASTKLSNELITAASPLNLSVVCTCIYMRFVGMDQLLCLPCV